MVTFLHMSVFRDRLTESMTTRAVPHRIRIDGRWQVLFLGRWRNVGNRGHVNAPEGEAWRVTFDHSKQSNEVGQ